jgi:molybdopterin molybdotransferase
VPLTPLADVQAAVQARITVLDTEAVTVADAFGRVVAVDVVATEAIPPFANSGMDGYAVRALDTAGASADTPVRLPVVDELPAGHAPTRALAPGEAIRIMTGAVFPDGADAVVMVEQTRRDGDAVLIEAQAAAGDHRRPAGGDVQPGQVVLTRGAHIGAPALGVLASVGRATVEVTRRPRVGVFSTGDELRDTGLGDAGPLVPGQIRDSNRPMLVALVREAGGEAIDLGVVRDDEATITAMLERAIAECDAIVTSGGVSMGDYDFVKSALIRMGALTWWQVAIKPAKPFAFGMVGRVPVFGLPGNPVSSVVSFELFARPALLAMQGRRDVSRPTVSAICGEDFPRRADGKLYLDRVIVQERPGGLVATRVGAQFSNALSGLGAANGLALLPDGPGLAAGDPIAVMLLGNPRAEEPS